MMLFTQPLPVLLVEDDDVVAHNTRESLKRVRSVVEMHRVGSVEAARRYLQREDAFANAQRPACLILDLHLADGRSEAFLDWMSQHDEFSELPVIVLSDGASDPNHPNVVCRLSKPARAVSQSHMDDGLASILFAAMDRSGSYANDNFAA